MLLLNLVLVVLTAFATSQVIEEFSCDFEDKSAPLCSYSPNPRGSRWSNVRFVGRASLLTDGPLKRSLPNSERYLRYDGDGRALIMSSLKAFSPQSFCFSFDFYLLRGDSELSVFLMIDSSLQVFHSNGRSSYVDKWQHFEQSVENITRTYRNETQIRIAAEGQIALDNLQISLGACRVPVNLTCDFETPFQVSEDNPWGCGWLRPLEVVVDNATTVAMRSVVQNAMNALHKYDQTTLSERGKYLKIYRPNINNLQDAIGLMELLVGEFLPEDGPNCFTFYYRKMYNNKWTVLERSLDGDIENELSSYEDVSIRDDNESQPPWMYGQADIDPVVAIRIILRISGTRDINLDSFKLTKGKCIPPVTCTFRNDMCGWVVKYSSYDDIRGFFRIGSGRTREFDVGSDRPPVPHSHHFLYMDPTSSSIFAMGTFLSQIVNSGLYCLKFDFVGGDGVYLKVNVITSANEQLILHHKRVRRNWTKQLLDIKTAEAFRIHFDIEKVRILGNFQLKDLVLEPGTCEHFRARRTQNVTGFSQVDFNCYQTGHFIPQYRSCDGVIDCPMGEDEGDHCEPSNCDMGGIPCKRRKFHFCLTDTKLYCNGVKDCEDGIDEDPRFCTKERFCENYCLNGGECWASDASRHMCQCPDSFGGKRCHQLLASEK